MTFKLIKSRTEFERKIIIDEIYEVLRIATNYNGKCFGGFVRDVIVPRENNPNGDYIFNDVDIWFTNEEDVNKFVEKVPKLKPFTHNFENKPTESYGFLRKKYCFNLYKEPICFFDLVISPTLPVDDFNVNKLYVKFDSNLKPLYEGDDAEIRALIQSILEKRAIILDKYFEKFDEEFFKRRVYLNYLEKDWEIFTESGEKIINIYSYNYKTKSKAYISKQIAELQALLNKL